MCLHHIEFVTRPVMSRDTLVMIYQSRGFIKGIHEFIKRFFFSQNYHAFKLLYIQYKLKERETLVLLALLNNKNYFLMFSRILPRRCNASSSTAVGRAIFILSYPLPSFPNASPWLEKKCASL